MTKLLASCAVLNDTATLFLPMSLMPSGQIFWILFLDKNWPNFIDLSVEDEVSTADFDTCTTNGPVSLSLYADIPTVYAGEE